MCLLKIHLGPRDRTFPNKKEGNDETVVFYWNDSLEAQDKEQNETKC